jgi:hypothetical protein
MPLDVGGSPRSFDESGDPAFTTFSFRQRFVVVRVGAIVEDGLFFFDFFFVDVAVGLLHPALSLFHQLLIVLDVGFGFEIGMGKVFFVFGSHKEHAHDTVFVRMHCIGGFSVNVIQVSHLEHGSAPELIADGKCFLFL